LSKICISQAKLHCTIRGSCKKYVTEKIYKYTKYHSMSIQTLWWRHDVVTVINNNNKCIRNLFLGIKYNRSLKWGIHLCIIFQEIKNYSRRLPDNPTQMAGTSQAMHKKCIEKKIWFLFLEHPRSSSEIKNDQKKM